MGSRMFNCGKREKKKKGKAEGPGGASLHKKRKKRPRRFSSYQRTEAIMQGARGTLMSKK